MHMNQIGTRFNLDATEVDPYENIGEYDLPRGPQKDPDQILHECYAEVLGGDVNKINCNPFIGKNLNKIWEG